MALTTRAVAQGPVASAATSRAAQPSSSVASYGGSQIEQLSSSAAVSFDNGMSFLPDDFGHQLPQQQQQGEQAGYRQRRNGPVPRTTSNDTFSALFRLMDFPGPETEEKPHVRGPKGFGGLLKKAISLYEENAKIIHGEMVPRGRKLRLAL